LSILYEVREGTCVTVPFDKLTSAVSEANPGAGKIVVAEDEVLVRLAISEALRAVEFTVYEAVNADEAIKLLSTFPDVDAVVTDMSMQTPVDGLTVLNFIRAHHPHVLVVLASAHSTETARFDAVFPKPFDPAGIIHWLKQKIGRAERGVADTA
jgi:two-component system, response regulator PdtaR